MLGRMSLLPLHHLDCLLNNSSGSCWGARRGMSRSCRQRRNRLSDQKYELPNENLALPCRGGSEILIKLDCISQKWNHLPLWRWQGILSVTVLREGDPPRRLILPLTNTPSCKVCQLSPTSSHSISVPCGYDGVLTKMPFSYRLMRSSMRLIIKPCSWSALNSVGPGGIPYSKRLRGRYLWRE